MAKLNGGYIGSDQRFSDAGIAKNKKHHIERLEGDRRSYSKIQEVGLVDLWINENSWVGGVDGQDTISTIKDFSGRGSDLNQIASSQGRAYRASAKNGLPGLEFNGNASQYYQASKNSLSEGKGDLDFDVTIIYVARTDSNTGIVNFGDNYSGPNSLRRSGLEWEAFGVRGETWDTSEFSLGNWEILTFVRDSSSAKIIEGKELSQTLPHLSNLFRRTSSMSRYINGKKLIKTKNNPSNYYKSFSFTSGNSWGLARGRNTMFNGVLGELIIYPKALNTKELTFVHETLSEKWDIALA